MSECNDERHLPAAKEALAILGDYHADGLFERLAQVDDAVMTFISTLSVHTKNPLIWHGEFREGWLNTLNDLIRIAYPTAEDIDYWNPPETRTKAEHRLAQEMGFEEPPEDPSPAGRGEESTPDETITVQPNVVVEPEPAAQASTDGGSDSSTTSEEPKPEPEPDPIPIESVSRWGFDRSSDNPDSKRYQRGVWLKEWMLENGNKGWYIGQLVNAARKAPLFASLSTVASVETSVRDAMFAVANTFEQAGHSHLLWRVREDAIASENRRAN